MPLFYAFGVYKGTLSLAKCPFAKSFFLEKSNGGVLMNELFKPVRALRGVGEKKAGYYAKLGIELSLIHI